MNTFIFLLDVIVWPLTVIIVIAILCSHIRKRDFLETKEREQDVGIGLIFGNVKASSRG